MSGSRVEVNDRMQQGYVYELTEPAGRNLHHDFEPQLTPKQMLELGVFGGKYMTDCSEEFPKSRFESAKRFFTGPMIHATSSRGAGEPAITRSGSRFLLAVSTWPRPRPKRVPRR